MQSLDHGEASARLPWLRPELVAPWWEIVLIAAVVIGLPAANSAWAAFHGSTSQYFSLLLTDRKMIWYIAIEGGILAALLGLLHWRGWLRADLRIRPGAVSTAQGLGLAPSMLLANLSIVFVGSAIAYMIQTKYKTAFAFLLAQSQHVSPHSIQVGWASLLAAMILNAFFEEITCMGYVFTQIAAKAGPTVSLVVTVLLRMSCHSYQGPVHMLGIGGVFLLAGMVYWRTRNLWPLIIAHTLVDIGSMSVLKILYG